MWNKITNSKYVLFSLLLLVSNLILIGFDFEAKSAIFDLRLDNFTSNYEELFAVIGYAILLVLSVFMKKHTFLVSVTFCEIVEIIRFIFIIKNYDVASYNYSSNTIIYTLVSVTLLAVIAYAAELKKAHFNLLRKLSVICIALYIVICIIPVLTIDSYINISSLIYYCALYLIFIYSAKKLDSVKNS